MIFRFKFAITKYQPDNFIEEIEIMIRQFVLPAAVAGTLLMGSAVQAANLVIDDYSDPGTAFEAFPGFSFCTSNSLGQCVYRNPVGGNHTSDVQTGLSVFGGSRSIDITPTTFANATFGVSTASSILTLANAGGVSSTSTVTYDASGSGLNINENSFGGFDSFDLSIPSADLGFDVTLELVSDLGGSNATGTLTLLDIGAGSNVPTTASFDFSDPAFAGVDFTDIDVVTLTLFGDADLDASLDQIGFIMSGITPDPTTPEPTTMLGLLAVGAFSFISRRRQK